MRSDMTDYFGSIQMILGQPMPYWLELDCRIKRLGLERVLPETLKENIILNRKLTDLQKKYDAIVQSISESEECIQEDNQ